MRAASPIVFLGLASALGCGDNLPLGDPRLHPVPGCEAFDPAPCDVRTTACQTRLLSLAACLRGDEAGALPPITVMTESEFATYMNALVATWKPAPQVGAWERAFNMVGLVQPGAFSPTTYVAETVKFVWGLYRGETKDILIIDHGDEFDDRSASTVLVHEFIHALQDRSVDLTAFQKAHAMTDDEWLAADAMIEGEARLHETHYRASANGLDPAALDWTQRFGETLRHSEAWMLKQPSPYTATRRAFPYEWGARYLHFTWRAGGAASVRRRFATPPATSRTLMASVDAAMEPEGAPPEVAVATPPPEWTPLGDTSIGAWGTFLLLAKNTTDLDGARALALGWRADGFFIFADASSSTTLVWRIDFADQTTAGVVASIAATGLGTASVRQLGSRVVIAKTDGAQPIDWAFVVP